MHFFFVKKEVIPLRIYHTSLCETAVTLKTIKYYNFLIYINLAAETDVTESKSTLSDDQN